MKVNLQYFSGEVVFPPKDKPVWAASIGRWHQLDSCSFGLVQAYHEWKDFLKKPSLVILASPLASNQADFDFVTSGAKSPSKMIHTLPSTRSSPLCQAMNWSGPVLCIQNDPHTQTTGLAEGFGLVNKDCPVVWVMSVMTTSPLRVTLFELSLYSGKPSTLTFPVSTALLKDFLPHRSPMLWIDEVLWVGENEGECRVQLRKGAHYLDREGIRVSSLVEWMAQGYGFIRVCQMLMQKQVGNLSKPEKTYLAAISDFEILDHRVLNSLQSGSVLIHMRTVRELTPLFYISGEVKTEEGVILAKGNLKVYAN